MKKIKQRVAAFFFRMNALALATAYNAAVDYKAELLKLLSLAPEATDEQITAELMKLNGEAEKEGEKKADEMTAMNSKLTAAQKAAADLQTKFDAQAADLAKVRGLAVNAALDHALATGRLIGAARAEWEGKLNANLETASAELATRAPAFNTVPLNLNAVGAPLAVPPEGVERVTAYNGAIAELQKAHSLSDADAEARMKSDPRYSALWKAVNEPASA